MPRHRNHRGRVYGVLLASLIVHNDGMKFRIGYGGPRQHRHGQYRPGERHNNGGMSEIERLIHLIASMQILFGSRRGGWVVPLLLIGLTTGGWYAYNQFITPNLTLEKAHAMYDSSDPGEQVAAIKAYKNLLYKKDPLQPGQHWLRTDRDTLYRRVIKHEVLNAKNEDQASQWATQAIEDGFAKLRFQNERVNALWEKTLGSIPLEKPPSKMKRDAAQKQSEPNNEPIAEQYDLPAENPLENPPSGEPGKLDVLPGVDDVGVIQLNRSLECGV